MRHLTTKQEHFCINYLLSNNARDAAIKAGYSKDTAVVIASQNLTKLNIKNRLVELRDKSESSKIMNIRERKEMLTLIGRFGGKLSISAIDTLNKMECVYGDQAKLAVNVDNRKIEIIVASENAKQLTDRILLGEMPNNEVSNNIGLREDSTSMV